MQLLRLSQVSRVSYSDFYNENSGRLLFWDTGSLESQDRFHSKKGINDEVTVIDGNSIPESGLLR